MIEIKKGYFSNLIIKPRWPQKAVTISEEALNALSLAQSYLSPDIRLMVTRAYQPETVRLKLMRRMGAVLFKIIYPQRKNEIPEIFGHNGHAVNGTHVDIGIAFQGKELTLLPMSVFTTLKKVNHIDKSYGDVVEKTKAALSKSGFSIHQNKIESMQIHCDFTG